ncbi:integrase catalytic domain-containing protein [Microvirga sp. STS02]|uniref:site-specific integrase n=1 Tax=Hymenobacter negativus TaxID=2795026 RepID=UPI0018DCD024|nr:MULTISPECIES: site-specific integrase [Bacteria]MBH8569388.1 integrase catalytic domain-containing protein [Hymenobacter negativus]MBR7209123.1 integrase catalytic domain-containing protein [Microvirga sp. STS02]
MPIRFYLHTKTYADGRRPIYLDARWGKGGAAGEGESRLRTGTGQSCKPEHFTEKGRLSGAAPGYAKSNRELVKLELAVTQHIDRAELDGTQLTPAALLALLKPAQAEKAAAAEAAAAPPVRTMAVLYQEWRNAHRARLAQKTLDGPAGLIQRLEEWRPGFRPEDWAPDRTGRSEALDEFTAYLVEQAVMPRTKRVGMQNNTISNYLRSLRKLLKFGGGPYEWVEDEFIEDVEREALTYEEVMQFYRHEPLELKEGSTNAGSRRAIRDVFVFNCFTGMRFGNLAGLIASDVVYEQLDGQRLAVLEYVQHKNRRAKRKIRVALSPIALEIWERYQGQLPVPTNQTMNGGIKTIARAAGLKRPVTTVRGIGAKRLEAVVPLWQAISCHTARYTFITLQYEGGTDIVFIQDAVGHASLNTTRGYLKTRAKERHVSTLSAFQALEARTL